MDLPEERYRAFAQVLSDDELKRLAAEHGVIDQRERRLPIRIFFWLMVLSASQPGVRGSLFQLAAFFVAGMSRLFAFQPALRLSKMALSKKLKATTWRFFHAVYQALLTRYEQLLPPSTRHMLDRFKEAYAIDGSIARVHSTLARFFASVHRGQAALTQYQVFRQEPGPKGSRGFGRQAARQSLHWGHRGSGHPVSVRPRLLGVPLVLAHLCCRELLYLTFVESTHILTSSYIMSHRCVGARGQTLVHLPLLTAVVSRR